MWAFLFPGQGSQSPGMGRFLYENFKLTQECFEEASEAIHFDLKKLCFSGSDEDLALTENTQPALLLVSTATQRVLEKVLGIKASYFAGHSVGEYAALVAAQSLNFPDAIRAVRKRGQCMQEAVPLGVGGMLAIVGPSSLEVKDLCAWAMQKCEGRVIAPANFNSPQQTVVSGDKLAVDWLAQNIKEYTFPSAPKRVLAMPLKVSAPFHCSMMERAEVEMRHFLSETHFNDATAPIVQNFTAAPVTTSSELKENLIRQITGSVRWVESKEFMNQKLKEAEGSKYIEAGPGKVLAGLSKKIDESIPVFNVNSLEEIKALEAML